MLNILNQEVNRLLLQKEYYEEYQSSKEYLEKVGKEIWKKIKERDYYQVPPVYRLEEIEEFELVNKIRLPLELKYYLTNISRVVYGQGYPTLFKIYEEQRRLYYEMKNKYLSTVSLLEAPELEPYLPPKEKTYGYYKAWAVTESALGCYISEYEYDKLTIIRDEKWSGRCELDDKNMVFFEGVVMKFCDGCRRTIKLGEHYYTELGVEAWNEDYCIECYSKLEVPLDKKFMEVQAAFLINKEQDCKECDKKGMDSYCILLDHKDREAEADEDYYFKKEYVCRECVGDRENIPIDLYYGWGKGSMMIEERGCGDESDIILNGKYRGVVMGNYWCNYNDSQLCDYAVKSFFNYLLMDKDKLNCPVDDYYESEDDESEA